METSDLSPFRVGRYWTYGEQPYIITRMVYEEEATVRTTRQLVAPHPTVLEEIFVDNPGSVELTLEPAFGVGGVDLDFSIESWSKDYGWYSYVTHQRWMLVRFVATVVSDQPPIPGGHPHRINATLIRRIS